MKKFLLGSFVAGIAAMLSFVPVFAQNNSSANGNNGQG
jgi:hypothetical protein